MGVFKWLRRERVTVTTHHVSPSSIPEVQPAQGTTQVGTIRTEKYKQDLAEFQARRSAGGKELQVTPPKKKCGRHSLPVSCTDCAADHDNTFNYEKKSAIKYKKHKRARSTTPEKIYDGVPNIQFLFQNQVFMPGGNMFTSSFSEPQQSKRQQKRNVCRSPDFVQRHIDFKDNDQGVSPPEFFKNNSLPFDVKNFLECTGPVSSKSDEEEVDGVNAAGDVKVSSQSLKDDVSDEKLWEVMSELRHLDQWADEQLLPKSPNASKSDDSKSDMSAYGLPVASARNLDINADRQVWNHGRWGVAPVQVKKLGGVTVEHVRKKRNTEINILRKCRHPNIILLMGIYPDINNNVHIICERCVDSLFALLHVQGRIISAQTSVQYTLDIANALVFLKMQGYIHTELNSMAIMITSHETAKLADLGSCVKVYKSDKSVKETKKDYEVYSPEPQYVNIEDTQESKSSDNEPLLSANPSETYLKSNAVAKPYESFQNSELYRWQAPELFEPDEGGMVHPCSKSDVYSLCMILWESCNSAMPWKLLTHEKLKEHYTLWNTGMHLPQDGTYPGCLLSLLQSGLRLDRSTRVDLETLQQTLQTVKRNLDNLGYIIIPARLTTKKSNFSSVAWDTSPTDSECHSPPSENHRAVIHEAKELPDSLTDSERDSKSDTPLYETIKKKTSNATFSLAQKGSTNDLTKSSVSHYELLPENYSSACSTPITKIKARIKDIDTSGLHRSDSTEYCSILSPNRTANLGTNDSSYKDQSSVERPTAKLSRSFTPKSYKPLHIKVPEFNLDSIKPLLKEQNSMERSSYNFDITNYSLPSTPIARSNKLRKNAWLSGDVSATEKKSLPITPIETRESISEKAITPSKADRVNDQPEVRSPESPETMPKSTSCSPEIHTVSDNNTSPSQAESVGPSPASVDTVRNSIAVAKRSQNFPAFPDHGQHKWWGLKPSPERNPKCKIEEDLLANMNVKPLVAIHERWIYEANRKAGRSMSLPEENSFRSGISAVKPASHCVDTLQKSLPQLNSKKPSKSFRFPTSPNSNGGHWDQFCQARDAIAKGVNFTAPNAERYHTWKKDRVESDQSTTTEDRIEPKIDQCTDTKGIEDFIRDLIRKEFQHLLHELSDDDSTITTTNNEDLLNKGVTNIMESLHNDDAERTLKKEPLKSFSRVKINGNNKPLLQITFSHSGENSLQVLDKCVNVTICDNPGRDKLNVSIEDTLTDDVQVGGLKRCQAFNAIQEARSTEDLYIDDELSAHLLPLGAERARLLPPADLHELLCEREGDCCLLKVKQEHGYDTVYFRCERSESEPRDAVDGQPPGDTVVFKRSISLIEERIQRVLPKDKRPTTPVPRRKTRPKSEIFAPISRETRILSNSSPSLVMKDKDEVEVNIENVMCYQDSSSDECLRCQAEGDDFELLEKKIEEDIASNNNMTLGCGCLGKISEENLSTSEDK